MDKTSGPCYRTPWLLWLKLCRLYNHFIECSSARLGEIVATYPLGTIIVCLLVVGSLASGLVFMETENRTEKLYIPQDSTSIKNLNKAKDYGFYRSSRQTEVIILNKKDVNVLNERCFRDTLLLHKLITNISGYIKLCLPLMKGHEPTTPSQCVTEEPLKFFNYSADNFDNILAELNDPRISSDRLFQRIFGTISRDNTSRITSAKAIRLVYFLEGSGLDTDISEETTDWEKEFLDQMKAFDSSQLKCGPIFYTTGRSIDDSISESTGSDIQLITVTFTVMISFACFMLGKYRNPLTGHGLLAMGGVLSVGIGILTAFGLSILIKTPFVSIVGLLPFLIIGVGIDDMFIIVDELDRTHPDQTIPKRLGMVMRHVGPAITMTTLTDLLAFAVGTTSRFPSIMHFCTYAAFSISLSFLFLVTFFVALMSFDCRRMKVGRRDILPCLKAPDASPGQRWDEPVAQASNKVMEWWGKLLMRPAAKGLVVVVSICLLGISIYGTTFINEEFDRRDLAKDGSEYIKFLDTLEDYFTEDIQVDLVIEPGVNYSDPSAQQEVSGLSRIVDENRYYRSTVVSWLDEFQNWLKNKNASADSTSFWPLLQQFLGDQPKFRADILFSPDNTTIKASRLYCYMKKATSSVTQRDAMTTLRSDLSDKTDLPVFASAYMFIFIEQFLSTLPETVRNLALAAGAILVITSLFLVIPVVVLVVLLGFVSLIFELLGLMHLWGVSLNSISMINLVMAIGFAVDYSAHIAHAFVFSRKPSSNEKVVDALRTVGASVFMGGFSTFLGMVVTGFASSEIFRIFFKMFFGIVVLGLLHGLCFLPVWLSVFCRQPIVVHLEENVNPNPTPAVSSAGEDKSNSKSAPGSNELIANGNALTISNPACSEPREMVTLSAAS